MNIETSIHDGDPGDCTEEQYHENVRDELQRLAGKYIDGGDMVRAGIALAEVKRLDAKFHTTPNRYQAAICRITPSRTG